MTDLVDFFRLRAADQYIDLCMAFIFVSAGQLHLDQFMNVERQAQFLDHGLGCALGAEQDERAQIMSEAAQVTDLRGGKGHALVLDSR